MSRKVAVEQSLSPVGELLAEKGYNVDSIDFNKEFTRSIDKYDVVVVSGTNENFLGVEDRNTNATVINAKGLTAEDIYNKIENIF